MTVRDAVLVAAKKYVLSPELLAAEVLVESAGDPYAFRFEPAFFKTYIRNNPSAKAFKYGPLAACSYGPMQIMLETACEFGFTGRPEDLFVPEIGMEYGAKYLSSLLLWAAGDYTCAWCAYNGGKGAVKTLPYPNQVYANKVLAMKGKPLTT